MPNANRPADLISPELAARFRVDLGRIADLDGDVRFGLAVSGGPDSMAMLLLAAAALPGRVSVATVDHGLRAEAAEEAAMVARFCASIGVPHRTCTVTVADGASRQAAARRVRYAALIAWCREEGLAGLLTAHHADDQAETILMRIARGAGLSGLRGIRERGFHSSSESKGIPGEDVDVLRPLLGWRRAELADIAAGIDTATDPSNADPHYDRTRARALLRETPWLDPLRLAATARHLADAEATLDWVTQEAIRTRATRHGDGRLTVDIADLPHDLRRRIVASLIAAADSPADGPTIETALARLDAGQAASVGALKLTPGRRIMIERARDRT